MADVVKNLPLTPNILKPKDKLQQYTQNDVYPQTLNIPFDKNIIKMLLHPSKSAITKNEALL